MATVVVRAGMLASLGSVSSRGFSILSTWCQLGDNIKPIPPQGFPHPPRRLAPMDLMELSWFLSFSVVFMFLTRLANNKQFGKFNIKLCTGRLVWSLWGLGGRSAKACPEASENFEHSKNEWQFIYLCMCMVLIDVGGVGHLITPHMDFDFQNSWFCWPRLFVNSYILYLLIHHLVT
jgi:hypothetical protein